MSIELVALVLNTCTELHISTKATLIALANHADPDGTHVFPSLARLARYGECDIRTIRRHLRILEAEGWIETVSEARQHRPTEYRLRADKLSPLGFAREDTGDSSDRTPVSLQTGHSSVPLPVIDPSVEPSLSEFAAFWKIYPRHQGRATAVKAYAKARKKVSAEELLAAAQRYRDDPNREDGFTLHGATWLNQERWQDPPLPPRENGHRPKPPEEMRNYDVDKVWAKIAEEEEARG